MLVRLKTSEEELSVGGTLFGRDHPRLVEVDGIEVDTIPQGRILFVRNDDTPGVVGRLGTLVGACSVNIARMSVGRKPGSSRAVMLLEVEKEIPEETLGEIRKVPGVRDARPLNLS